jgi:HTH-type transcriptional regulator/antitoxin HipB
MPDLVSYGVRWAAFCTLVQIVASGVDVAARSVGDLHDRADSGSELGRALRGRRRDLQLTQQDVADLAEVSVRFLHELERGKPGVRLDKLLAVLRALGLHLELAPGIDPAPAASRTGARR